MLVIDSPRRGLAMPKMPYSKFKTFLRKVAARTVPGLNRAIRSFIPSSVRKNVPTISDMQAMLQYDRNPLFVRIDRTYAPSMRLTLLGSWLNDQAFRHGFLTVS